MAKKQSSDYSIKEYYIKDKEKLENIKKVLEEFEQFKELEFTIEEFQSSLPKHSGVKADETNISLDSRETIENILEKSRTETEDSNKTKEESIEREIVGYNLVLMGDSNLVDRAHVYIDAFAKETILPERVKKEPKKRRRLFGLIKG